jgi:AraC-like DNA-binding protein
MDPLSDVLQSARFHAARFFNAALGAPWCLDCRGGRAGFGAGQAGADHVVTLYVVTEGGCRIRLDGEREAIDARAGDLLLLAHADAHRIGSELHGAAFDADSLRIDSAADGAGTAEPVHLRLGGAGEVTRLVVGHLACDRAMAPLLDALPRLVHVADAAGPTALLLRELLRRGARESSASRPGTDSALARIAELVFIDALRRYAELLLPPAGKGWLAALRDPRIGRALALLHAEPAQAWTLDELADRVALSRSALADRFAALVGEPPMQYLMRWRLAIAARALRSGAEAIVRIAERAGYESDAAFSRAFKREFGMPPAAWRRRAALAA